jgi:Flp pilus assembly pilin Flp
LGWSTPEAFTDLPVGSGKAVWKKRGEHWMHKMVKKNKRNMGQAIIEYVLIIAIVVVASVAILGVFSDTVRKKIAGIVKVFDPDADVSAADTSAQEILEDLDENGIN